MISYEHLFDKLEENWKERKCAENSSWFLSSWFNHNFLILTPNHLIQFLDLFDWFSSLSFVISYEHLFEKLEENWKRRSAEFLHDFCCLVSIITFSFQLRITWFKSQKCWSWWGLQISSIFRAKWLCDCFLWAYFSPRFIFVSETFSSYFHFLSSLLIFIFDWWNVLRMMLVHILGLYDWLIIEF